MTLLVLGLVLFLGVHSVRIVADDWRSQVRSRLGENRWKGLYSLLSLAGLLLIVWGYGEARASPVLLWDAPTWTRHVAALLMLVSFVLLLAAYVPANGIKARVGHPMVAGVKVWAFAHLLANGALADVLLFGAFLAWAVADFMSARRRDRAAGTVYPPGRWPMTMVTLVAGGLFWAVFAFALHGMLFGVRPLG